MRSVAILRGVACTVATGAIAERSTEVEVYVPLLQLAIGSRRRSSPIEVAADLSLLQSTTIRGRGTRIGVPGTFATGSRWGCLYFVPFVSHFYILGQLGRTRRKPVDKLVGQRLWKIEKAKGEKLVSGSEFWFLATQKWSQVTNTTIVSLLYTIQILFKC